MEKMLQNVAGNYKCGPLWWKEIKHMVLVIFTFMSLSLSSDGKVFDNILFISDSAKERLKECLSDWGLTLVANMF